jgi:hypothetical protein
MESPGPLIVWLLWTVAASSVVSYIAHTKARRTVSWFLAGVFLTPFFAVLCLLALPSVDKTE